MFDPCDFVFRRRTGAHKHCSNSKSGFRARAITFGTNTKCHATLSVSRVVARHVYAIHERSGSPTVNLHYIVLVDVSLNAATINLQYWHTTTIVNIIEWCLAMCVATAHGKTSSPRTYSHSHTCVKNIYPSPKQISAVETHVGDNVHLTGLQHSLVGLFTDELVYSYSYSVKYYDFATDGT